MTRRASLASFFIAVTVIAPLFALGGILDWPDQAFAWIVLGVGPIGMLIGYSLFYEESESTPERIGTQSDETLAELIGRIETLERRLRDDLEVRRAESGGPTAPRPTAERS
jgi:hypothetical protein